MCAAGTWGKGRLEGSLTPNPRLENPALGNQEDKGVDHRVGFGLFGNGVGLVPLLDSTMDSRTCLRLAAHLKRYSARVLEGKQTPEIEVLLVGSVE